MFDPAASNSDTRVDSAVTVYIQSIQDIERNSDSTHPESESDTNDKRLWFDSADKQTKFWAGIQWLDGQEQAAVNTVLPQPSLTKAFHERPNLMFFSKVDKTCLDIFGILQRFIETLLESENLVCSATARTKTALGII